MRTCIQYIVYNCVRLVFLTLTIDSTNVFVQRMLIDRVMLALAHPTKHVAFSIPAVLTQKKQGSAFVLGQSWIVLDTSLSCDIYNADH